MPVEVAVFSDLRVWEHDRPLTSRVLSLWVQADSAIVHEQDLTANALSRYSVGGRTFLYSMYAYPCDPLGCIGADVLLAYYDENGNGKFTVKEFPNPMLSADPSRNWKPRVPAWVRRQPVP
jgi:hypothetical protein